jgi:MFS family permease
LPIFFVTQCLQFLDRTALNYANLFGYQKALSLHGDQFNYLSAIVYAGYFFGQYPCGWLIGRFPAQKVLAISCMIWGLMVLLLTQCHNYGSAMFVRFMMGMFEAAVTPGLTLMTGWYYTRAEIPLRQCVWYSSLGFGGILGSYISMGISEMPEDTVPERWQLIFYILGGVTMAWSFVIWFCLPDTPSTARFLTPKERLIAVARVATNTTGIKSQSFDRTQALLSFRDWKTHLIFLSTFAAAIPNGVINSFSTVIIRDLGFSTTRTTQLKSVGDATQVVSLLIAGIITLNIPNTRLLVSSFFNILCTVAAACVAFLPRNQPWGRLVAFWLTNSQSVSFTIALTMVSSNMAGYSHRTSASALVFSAYCWGNVSLPRSRETFIGHYIDHLFAGAVRKCALDVRCGRLGDAHNPESFLFPA